MKGLVIAAIAAAAGLVLATAINTETDKQLEQIDKFIEAHQVLRTDFAPASQEEATLAEEETTLVQDLAEEVAISPEEFQVAGIIDWNGWRYTYYSEQVLPGEGLNIPGRWSDGTFVRDENGYICVACNDLEQGTVVATPFGDAIVYDWVGDDVHGIIDIYVSF